MIVTTLNGWPRRALALMCLLAAAVAGMHRPTSGVASGSRAGPVAHILIAAQDLAAGTTLTGGNVRATTVPTEFVPDGALGSLTTGRIVGAPVRRGEPITDARLLGPGLATGLSPPETRAIPVRLADGQTASLLRPGDRIDLFATPVNTGLGATRIGGTDLDSPPGPSETGGSLSGRPSTDPTDGGSSASGTSAAGTTGGAATAPGQRSAPGRRPSGPAAQPDTAVDSAASATLLASGVRVLAVLAEGGANPADGVLVVVAASDRTARQLAAAGSQERLSVAIRPP